MARLSASREVVRRGIGVFVELSHRRSVAQKVKRETSELLARLLTRALVLTRWTIAVRHVVEVDGDLEAQ